MLRDYYIPPPDVGATNVRRVGSIELRRRKRKRLRARLIDWLYLLGAALISVGMGLWSLPAGLVAGGVFCLVASFLIDRSGGKGDDAD